MKALISTALAALLLSTSMGAAQAQGPASAPGMGMGPGTGMGMGGMRGHRMNGDNTYGWSLMSPAERQAHHDKMIGMKTYEECKAYREQHHAQMVERAKAGGRALPSEPRYDACAPLKKK